MRFLNPLFIVSFILLTAPSFALEQPFAWPESYTVTITEQSKYDKSVHFVNVFHTNGHYSRNENTAFGLSIIRPDQHKEYTIHPDGKATVRRELPNNIPAFELPKSYFYPKDGTWQTLGTDTINGQQAVKYRVDNRYRSALFWLTPDYKTPLRYEEGNVIVHFSNYSAGPQYPELFEVPGVY